MIEDRAALLAAVLAERYARPLWWTTPAKPETADDSDIDTARRRRDLVAEANAFDERQRASA